MSEEIKNVEEVKELVTVIPEVPVVEPKMDSIEVEAVAKSDEEAQKEMLAILSNNETVALAETAIQNNEIKFDLDGISYRVRKSNFKEKQEANQFRMKRFVELLKDKEVLLQKDLIKIYKDRGIDIEGIDKQVLELDGQQKALMLDLGKAIKENRSKPELEQYKQEIINATNSIQGLQQEKQQLLEYSLENRILMEVYSYMIWMIAEKKQGENWVKIWNTYEEFLSSDNMELLGQVTKFGAVVVTDDMTSNVKM